ncbi:Nucleolar protein 6 [Chelonia mydas]|uniref:Nucleolar protein 6 n=1 Tax=Chelonia mydas TaxID=8469 RepID=M7B3P3_CHEMY|nr:Nucleolar protein 6 [Chelonia mydas]
MLRCVTPGEGARGLRREAPILRVVLFERAAGAWPGVGAQVFDNAEGDMETEEENQDLPKKGKAQGRKRASAAEGVVKQVKLSRADLYKLPTNEELNQLKETENLFHSSLLRLQIEELLKEVKLKEKKKQKIDAFLHEINTLLSAVPETLETDLADQSWLPKDVKVPFLQVPSSVKGKFRFLPPATVTVVGSYLLGTCIKPEINVDLAVTMPRAILQDKDNLNQRYHRKRALYLAHIAQHLSKEKLFGSVRFTYMNSNHLKPIVLLQPQGKDKKLVTVRLYACPAPGFFKPSRLYPSKNNVRTAWFLEQGSPGEGAAESPTPHYNNSILCDTGLESNLLFLAGAGADFPGMRDGVTLLKVWLHQWELDKGLGCLNGFMASMLVAYLLAKHKISQGMSGYQVLRSVLQFLATSDLSATGISLSKDSDSSLPTLADFHQAFEVVFVDPSGLVNLCADMTASKYKQVQFEAKRSMEVLDDRTVDGFQLLLMTPKPLIRTFDHVFHLKHVSKLQGACKKMQLLNELMDRGGNYVAAALPFVTSLLARGLAGRVLLLTHSLPQAPQWPISAEPPKHKDAGHLSFGLLLTPEFATSILEKGPEADRPEAAEFRKFWGEKSELRRFQDGAICEAVVWGAETMCQKRLIPEQIVKHLLWLHADIPESSICYTGAVLESVIRVGRESCGGREQQPAPAVPDAVGLVIAFGRTQRSLVGELPAGTGEEAMVSIVRSYDDLSRKLWNLEGLPLMVTAVQGTHPTLRYTEVFPPTPMKPDYSYHMRIKDKESLLPLAEKPCPAYIAPMKVVCHMEGSGQGPLDGYVFRLQVAYHREPHILKEVVTPEGMLKYRDTEESQQLELETLHLPYLTSSLHGLQQQHPAFSGTCRLAKRWVRAQLLSDSLSDECVDLLAASLFLHPAPFTPPSSPQVGFLRFLHLLTAFDWKNSPLIVNLNADLKEPSSIPKLFTYVKLRCEELPATKCNCLWVEYSSRFAPATGLFDADYTEIRNEFVAARPHLPVMFIATPRDKRSSVWTKERPSTQILQRLLVLALESLRALEEQLTDPLGSQDVKMVFRPPLDFYDILIHLNAKQIPRHLEGVDRPAKSFSRGMLKSDAPVKTLVFPVVGYDPVQCYLQELREAFGDLALFFYDSHGGEVIGVLWKPSSFEPQPFKASNMKGRMMASLSCEELVTVPNVEAILEDFEILGEGPEVVHPQLPPASVGECYYWVIISARQQCAGLPVISTSCKGFPGCTISFRISPTDLSPQPPTNIPAVATSLEYEDEWKVPQQPPGKQTGPQTRFQWLDPPYAEGKYSFSEIRVNGEANDSGFLVLLVQCFKEPSTKRRGWSDEIAYNGPSATASSKYPQWAQR